MPSSRYIIRLLIAFFKRYNAIILIGTLFGIVFFILLYFFIPNLTSTTEKIGMIGRFSPDNLPNEILELVSSGLTKIDKTGTSIPNIAKSWETSDGGKTWIFTINDNLVWQDGKKLTTDDINYEFSDARIEKPDPFTIKFLLDSKFSAFPIIVAKPIFKQGLLGTGDWKVKKVSITGSYIQSLTIVNKNRNKKIFKFFPTEDRLRLAFKLGEVDVISNLQNPKPFDTWKTVSIEEKPGVNNFVGIFLNTQNSKLSEKSIRQALNYAINKTDFSETRAIGPLSPNSWGYNPQVKQYLKDSEKVGDAMDLEIKLSTLPNLLETADMIAKDWEEVGVVVEIEVVSKIPNDYEAFLATVDIPKDPDQYSLWHSTQTATNISNYKNARIDKLLEDGRTELDQETRRKIYLDFQKFLVEDVPAIFLYQPTFYTVIRK